jgi:hypothetical protein
MHPGVDPCDRDRPAPVPSGTKRVKVETPSVVSRADRVAPDAESRLSRLPRVSRGCTHRSHPEAGPRCVRQHAVRSASGPAPCRRFALRLLVRQGARCFGPTSAISRLRTSTRASLVPVSVMSLRSCLAGDFLVHARESSLQRAALAGFSSSREALSSPRHVCGRASDIPVAALRCTVCARTPGVTLRVAKAAIPLPA